MNKGTFMLLWWFGIIALCGAIIALRAPKVEAQDAPFHMYRSGDFCVAVTGYGSTAHVAIAQATMLQCFAGDRR